jgi:hypothetical protein
VQKIGESGPQTLKAITAAALTVAECALGIPPEPTKRSGKNPLPFIRLMITFII